MKRVPAKYQCDNPDVHPRHHVGEPVITHVDANGEPIGGYQGVCPGVKMTQFEFPLAEAVVVLISFVALALCLALWLTH